MKNLALIDGPLTEQCLLSNIFREIRAVVFLSAPPSLFSFLMTGLVPPPLLSAEISATDRYSPFFTLPPLVPQIPGHELTIGVYEEDLDQVPLRLLLLALHVPILHYIRAFPTPVVDNF